VLFIKKKPIVGEIDLVTVIMPHYGCGVDSGSNRNAYQEYFLGVKAASVYG